MGFYMKNKRLVALTLAGMMGLTSLAGATTAFAASDSNTVAAPTNATGSVYVSIEKSTAYKKGANVDYVLAPVKVDLADVATAMGGTDALTPDDGITDITILDVLKTAYGQNNFTYEYRPSYNCYYVSAIKDNGVKNYVSKASEYQFADAITNLGIKYTTTYTGIKDAGMLTENDIMACVSTVDSTYKGGSGWMISQNNVGPYYGVSTKVAADDTLRMEWSSFNGMDVGYAGYLGSNWTQVAPFIYASSSAGDYGTDYVKVNKDALVKKLAEINAEYSVDDMLDEPKNAYDTANAVVKDIVANSSTISTALQNLNFNFAE